MPQSENNQADLSVLVYRGESSPRLYRLNKNFIKFTITVLPFIALFALAGLTFLTLRIQSIKEEIKLQEPELVSKLQAELAVLHDRNHDLESFNKDLQERLVSGENIDLTGMSALSLFRPVAGMQNLSHSPLLTIDNFEVNYRENEVEFNFHITNQTANNERLSGYLFVIFKAGPTIHLYPRSSGGQDNFQLSFTDGESFATQRFRPVDNIRFPISQQNERGLLQIVIFSRTGDLLHRQLMSVNLR